MAQRVRGYNNSCAGKKEERVIPPQSRRVCGGMKTLSRPKTAGTKPAVTVWPRTGVTGDNRFEHGFNWYKPEWDSRDYGSLPGYRLRPHTPSGEIPSEFRKILPILELWNPEMAPFPCRRMGSKSVKNTDECVVGLGFQNRPESYNLREFNMGKPDTAPTQTQRVAEAMNEQGFLFSQRIRDVINFGDGTTATQQGWTFMEKEYPVTASDGTQTRIDLVLRNTRDHGIFVCLECKRANPDYKQWIFFDKAYQGSPNQPVSIFVEVLRISQRPNGVVSRMIRDFPATRDCSVFGYYLEVAIKRDGRSGHTETIEDALYQVVKGHTGLIRKMQDFETPLAFSSIPVVVTTAELFEASFDSSGISLETGSITADKIQMRDVPFCAVTYHPNDNLAVKLEGASNGRTSISNDMAALRRTVFVVRSTALTSFLDWLSSFLGGRI